MIELLYIDDSNPQPYDFLKVTIIIIAIIIIPIILMCLDARRWLRA